MNKSKQEIELLAFYHHGKWGVKDASNNVIILPQFDELNAFYFEGEIVTKIFESKSKGLLVNLRKNRMENSDNAFCFYKPNGLSGQVLFIVNRYQQSFLLRLEYDPITQIASTTDLLKEYKTYEFWSMPRSEAYSAEKPAAEEYDMMTYQDCYKKIDYIGNSLFKVEVMTPYQSLEQINEDGDTSWTRRFFPPAWKILTPLGQFLPLRLESVEVYFNDHCKIKHNGKYNLINKDGKVVNKRWFNHLIYPAFGQHDFLAGSYFLIHHTVGNIGEGRSLFRTTDLYPEDNSNGQFSPESQSLHRKFNKINLSGKELALLLNTISDHNNYAVDELSIMDLYDSKGIKKRLRIGGLTPLTDTLFVCTVFSDFFYYFDSSKKSYKLVRHTELTTIPTIDYCCFSFEQKKLINIDGNFVNSNYYHDIFDYGENGKALVSKTYFKSGDTHIDTSVSEFFSDEPFEFWKDNGSYRYPICIKYGLVDRNGNEIQECKFDRDELNG